MFGRASLSFIALIASMALGAYFFLLRISPEDASSYQKLCKEKNTLRSSQALERQPAVQFRENVQKDIWIADCDQRLHFLLKSSSSELTLAQKKDKVEAIEKLKQIDSWMQDEIDETASTQQVTRMAAETGIYSFPAHRFMADSVLLEFYRLPGTVLPKERIEQLPFFSGTAAKVELAANETPKKYQINLDGGVKIEAASEHPPFSISSMKANCSLPAPFSLFHCDELRFETDVEIRTLDDIPLVAQGGTAVYKNQKIFLYPSIPSLRCRILKGSDQIDARTIVFDPDSDTVVCEEPEGFLASNDLRFSARKLLFKRDEGKIFLREDVRIWQNGAFAISSDQGIVELDSQSKPALLNLAGQIHLASRGISGKESFASADALAYNLVEETILLTASPSKRVLFWQEGLQLSAPEVKIENPKNPQSGKIEGRGDVRFAFDLEERNFIEDFLSKFTSKFP